jgi:hypothetical protein
MRAEDLVAELEKKGQQVVIDRCDPCTDALVRSAIHRLENEKRGRQGFRDVKKKDHGCVVLVDNEETGCCEYKVLYADGHLGAVEDL